MIVTSLDLEFNQPTESIIQIGACIGDTNTSQIIDKLRIYINTNEILDPRIITLCGITQEEHDKGTNLKDAYIQLKDFHIKHKAFMNPLTWGGGDSISLKDQITKKFGVVPQDWVFGRRWIDVKTIYIGYRVANGLSIKGGLAKSCKNMGFNFEGRKHDALDDSVNTFKIFCALLNKLKEPSSERQTI